MEDDTSYFQFDTNIMEFDCVTVCDSMKTRLFFSFYKIIKIQLRSHKSRKSKNELLALSLGLTSSDLDNLINQPIEVMAHMAEARGFKEDEVNILRDIRRRGKNLIAAHHCRNRKLGAVEV